MKFKSRKDKTFKLTIAGLSLLFAILIGESYLYMDFSYDYFIVFDSIVLTIWIFVLWTFFGTSYEVTEEEFLYTNGPKFGSIKLTSIKKILIGKTAWSGKKPATARKGLIIYYDDDKQIYITPKTNNSFVDYIKRKNPSIEVEIYQRHILK